MNTPITSPTAGLLARYGLNEGTGTAVGDSIAPAENGTAQPTANAPSWTCRRTRARRRRHRSGGPDRTERDLRRRQRRPQLERQRRGRPGWLQRVPGHLEPGQHGRRAAQRRHSAGRLPVPRHDRHARHDLLLRGDGRGHVRQRVRCLERGQRLTRSVQPGGSAVRRDRRPRDPRSCSGTGRSTNFTLEAWFKKTGTGHRNRQGQRGHHRRRPADREGSGRRSTTGHHRRHRTTSSASTASGQLVAVDFEETATGPSTNHPFIGLVPRSP